MRKTSRLLLVAAAVLLVPAFALPLWSIRLVAPQYGEGLGLYIGLSDIRGHTQHDIQNINILNHYIGMKPIVPAEVGVLSIMPWALGALLVLALLAAALGRRGLVIGWLAVFAGLGAAGLREFRAWNYDYGHNLSADAPIKVPGMTYQPPLIGSKTLLNIRASSYPSWGSLFVGLGFLAGLLALANEYRRRPERPRPAGRPARARPRMASAAAVGILAAVVLAGCGAVDGSGAHGAEIAEFAPGQPPSDYCDGVIPEARFGGEIVTSDGRTYRFMSVECLAGFVIERRVDQADIRSMRVVDFNHGERLIDAAQAIYVRSQFRPSPNGLHLLATDSDRIAHNLRVFWGGDRLDWTGVLDLVRAEWQL